MATVARIFKPSKTAMQSGSAKTQQWRLEFEPENSRFIEHIMGWTGSDDTGQQVKLGFDSKADAIRYAEKHGLEYRVQEPRRSRFKQKSYADNFAYNRVDAYKLVHKQP